MRQPVVEGAPVELVVLDHLQQVEEPRPAVVERVGDPLVRRDDRKHLCVVSSSGEEVGDHEAAGHAAVANQEQSGMEGDSLGSCH